MKSCIYEGVVRHARHRPVRHKFSFRLFLLYLDLDEIDAVFADRLFWSANRPAPARFRRADHLGDPDLPLDEAVRRLVRNRTGSRPGGPVRLLTHLSYFGYCFNPISIFFCFSPDGSAVEFLVMEVSNTPGGNATATSWIRAAKPVGSCSKKTRRKSTYPLSWGCRWDTAGR